MRESGTDQQATPATPAPVAPAGVAVGAAAETSGPGKHSLTEQASATSTQRDGSPARPGPGKQSLVEVAERAEQRLARPGYHYLASLASPLIAEARQPGADPSLAARLDALFEVSKSDGAGALGAAKRASNAYHAALGDQAIAELSSRVPAGATSAREALEPVARSLEARYAPLLEDDVHLQVHLGQTAGKGGSKTPAVSVEVSIRPNDFWCIGWLSWDTVTGLWRLLRGGGEPANAPTPPTAPTERSPLLGEQPAQESPVAHPPPPVAPMDASGGAKDTDGAAAKTASGSGEAASDGAAPGKGAKAEAPEEATAFAAQYKATGMPTANPVGSPKVTPHPGGASAEGGKKQPGYVINMATIPSEVQPTMASRYFEGERAGAADRTAVVVGVNSFLGMDAGKDAAKAASISEGVGAVAAPPGQMAVFGYTWEPGWLNKDNEAVSLSTVREAWRKLPSSAQGPAAQLMDGAVKNTLPYGFFRNQVLNSPHTRQAVSDVGKHADPVHIVVQDADGGVASASGKHVLTAYDEVLSEMARHPLLTIGGYHFQGHTWPEGSSARTQRLTELSNEIDRAIRAAIATVYPEMLYPTEPNMLIKAQDQEHHDGLFDRKLDEVPGGLFGLGASEGRTARQHLMRADNAQGADKHPQPIHYAPSTSTMTSPVPERPERGLTVPATPEHVEYATSGKLYQDRTNAKKVSPDKQYASMVVEEQSQNPLAPRRLNQEFIGAWEEHDPDAHSSEGPNPSAISNANKRKVKAAFEQPAAAVKDITSPPPVSEAVEPSAEASSSAAPPVGKGGKAAKAPKAPKAPAPVDPAVAKAQEVARAIVTAMSEESMQEIWRELRDLLAELQKEAEAKKAKGGGSDAS